MAKTLTDPDVKIREYRGLLEAMHAYGLTEGLILTMDEEGEEEIEKMQVKILPIWKWLLLQKKY